MTSVKEITGVTLADASSAYWVLTAGGLVYPELLEADVSSVERVVVCDDRGLPGRRLTGCPPFTDVVSFAEEPDTETLVQAAVEAIESQYLYDSLAAGGAPAGGGGAGAPGGAVAVPPSLVDAPAGHVWMAVEPVGKAKVGESVQGHLLAQTTANFDVLFDCGGDLVHVRAVPVAELSSSAKARETEVVKLIQGDSGDVRTLAVDYDEQGQRYKEWRLGCSEMFHNSDPDVTAIEGPPTFLHLAKHWHRHGGTPNSFFDKWLREKNVATTDRISYELNALFDMFEWGWFG